LEIVVERTGPEPATSCLVVLSDITEEKRAETVIHDQEIQLRLIADTTPVMLTRCGRDLRYRYVNRACAELLGFAPEEIVGKPIAEIMGAEAFEAVRPHLENVLQGQRVEFERVVPYARGGPRFVHVVYTPERGQNGEVQGWLGSITDITERKRAEEALRESEARFGYMADAAPVLIWMAGTDKLCTYFNQPWLQFTGRALEQELGNGWAEGLHPEDLQRCLKIYAESFDARREFRMEYRLRRQDGEYRWLLDHGIPRFAEQRFLGYIGSCVDITILKEAESAMQGAHDRLEQQVQERTQALNRANEALRREKTFSDSLIELAPAVIAVVDPQGNLVRTNAYAQQLAGYPFAETQGRNMIEMFVPKEERPRLGQLLQDVLLGRVAQAVIAPLRTRDGNIRQIEWYSKPIANAAGEHFGALAIGQDITERLQADDALRRSERHLSNFFNEAPVGLVWLSASGIVLRANQAQLDLLGCRPADFLSHTFQEFLVDPACGTEVLKRLAARETVRNFGLRLRCRDGELRHVLVDANSSWNGDQFEYSSIFLRDITDRLQLEQEILHISEREHLRIAQDLHDGLGQLLVGAGYLAGTVRQDLAAQFRPEARQLRRIGEVINEAVGMTRKLARGLHPVEAEPNGLMVALAALASRTRKLFQVRCDFNCRGPVLLKDDTVATHLFRIAQEAVTNAIKHGKPGRIQIRLTHTQGGIKLAVKDDGSGMPDRQRKVLGMGLRIMRYRASIIGGSLAIESEAGGGTSVNCAVHLTAPDLPTRNLRTARKHSLGKD
jgi:PAS domain S-box-containing protein